MKAIMERIERLETAAANDLDFDLSVLTDAELLAIEHAHEIGQATPEALAATEKAARAAATHNTAPASRRGNA